MTVLATIRTNGEDFVAAIEEDYTVRTIDLDDVESNGHGRDFLAGIEDWSSWDQVDDDWGNGWDAESLIREFNSHDITHPDRNEVDEIRIVDPATDDMDTDNGARLREIAQQMDDAGQWDPDLCREACAIAGGLWPLAYGLAPDFDAVMEPLGKAVGIDF